MPFYCTGLYGGGGLAFKERNKIVKVNAGGVSFCLISWRPF